jgi:hypothetical protein
LVANPSAERVPVLIAGGGPVGLALFDAQFVLLQLGERPPDCEALEQAATAAGLPLRTVRIEDPEVAALYERNLVLVRPDGIVAWRDDAAPGDPVGLSDCVRGA